MKALLVTASLCLGTAPAMARGDDPNVDAIWLPQVVNFVYQAEDNFYTCSNLWQKVTGILAHLGARNAAPVQRITCNDFAPTVRMQIALESPAEATPANLQALTDYDTEDLMIARLHGRRLPTANDVPRFPAAWTTLSTRSREMRLSAGDCQLVHQLRRQVLPKLSIEVLKEPTRCTPVLSRGGGGLAPMMKVRALTVSG